MKVLIACEFSGVVRRAFRALGHNAWSCDLLPAEDSGEHIQADALEVVHAGGWDLMIAHPPYTYIGVMSNCRINEPGRKYLREQGMKFFMSMIHAPISKIAVENPKGLPERRYRKADQVIQPWEFGHPCSKATCLWLKNLPCLHPTNIVKPERKWDGKRWRTWVDSFGSGNACKRSITFEGIAAAMAEQWGNPMNDPMF